MILARLFSDAAALWRGDRDLWVRLASVLFFVPAFAVLLFAQFPDSSKLGQDPSKQQELVRSITPWLAGIGIWMLYSSAVILVLVLDRMRPTPGKALLRALRLFPGLLLANLCTSLLFSAGVSFFVVPGLYIVGRTYLTQALLVAEPKLGPLGALFAAVQHSHRRGWLLFVAPFTVAFAALIAATIVEAFGIMLGASASAPLHFVFAGFEAAVLAAGGLAQALLQAAAYRVLVGARQGT